MTTTQTATPTQHCTTCATGPFFYVTERLSPTLCIDCAYDADRAARGWSPESSAD